MDAVGGYYGHRLRRERIIASGLSSPRGGLVFNPEVPFPKTSIKIAFYYGFFASYAYEHVK